MNDTYHLLLWLVWHTRVVDWNSFVVTIVTRAGRLECVSRGASARCGAVSIQQKLVPLPARYRGHWYVVKLLVLYQRAIYFCVCPLSVVVCLCVRIHIDVSSFIPAVVRSCAYVFFLWLCPGFWKSNVGHPFQILPSCGSWCAIRVE